MKQYIVDAFTNKPFFRESGSCLCDGKLAVGKNP